MIHETFVGSVICYRATALISRCSSVSLETQILGRIKSYFDCISEHGPSAQQPRVTLVVDGDHWMAFYCTPRLARVLQSIRREINKMMACSLSAAVTDDALFYYHGKLMETVALLLTLPVQKPISSSPW